MAEPHPALPRGSLVLVGTTNGGLSVLEGSLQGEPSPLGPTVQLGSSAQARCVCYCLLICAAFPIHHAPWPCTCQLVCSRGTSCQVPARSDA